MSTVEPQHLSVARCAILNLLDIADHTVAWAAVYAARHPDEWNESYRDKTAFESMVLRLEYEQLGRELDDLRTDAAS